MMTLHWRFRKRLNADDPLQIITYQSYGTFNLLYVKGRLLKDKGIRKSLTSSARGKILRLNTSFNQRF